MNEPLNFALSGYGKMGVLLEKALLARGHKVSVVIDPKYPEKRTKHGADVYSTFDGAEKALSGVNTAIDFTTPQSAVQNIYNFAARRIPLVVGTTGWYEKLPEITEFVKKHASFMLYAPNFSLGVNLFYKVAAYSASLFSKYAEYDAAGFEIHHNKKADSPSGTAKTLCDLVLRNFSGKKGVVFDKLDRPPEPEEFHFASLRVGSEPGVHCLLFDSAADTVEIKHTARNREGLVSGAVFGAEALFNITKEKQSGVYTLEDVL